MRASSVLVASLVCLSGCNSIRGSGVPTTETRDISDFSEVEVSGGVDLEVTLGPTSFTIEGDDNIVPLYSSKVVDGRLTIRRTTPESVNPRLKISVRVTTPSLSRLDASGGTTVVLKGVAAPKFRANLSGGVDLRAMDLDIDSLELAGSGGASVSVSGRTQSETLKLSGGVHVSGKGLETKRLALEASGGSEVEATAYESVTGVLSGGVDVEVSGNPARKQVRTSGGSAVKYLN